MDLIQRAQEKREWHRTELARLESFLATAFELERDLAKDGSVARDKRSDSDKADAPIRQRVARQRGGVGADTVAAAEEIIRDRGPLPTRDLLPLIRAKGIEVGGNDPVATLSARISNRSSLESHHGKWRFREISRASDAQASEEEEAADSPAKEQSTASMFTQTKEQQYAAALVQ